MQLCSRLHDPQVAQGRIASTKKSGVEETSTMYFEGDQNSESNVDVG